MALDGTRAVWPVLSDTMDPATLTQQTLAIHPSLHYTQAPRFNVTWYLITCQLHSNYIPITFQSKSVGP